MSSQDSEQEIYVADDRANSRINGDLEPYGWTTDEEEDYEPKGKEQTSSDEEEAPLPQLGHTQESKQELCQRVLKLEEENDDPRDQNFMLKWKLDKL